MNRDIYKSLLNNHTYLPNIKEDKVWFFCRNKDTKVPYGTTDLVLNGDFNKPLDEIDIPSTVTTILVKSPLFDQPLKPGDIPPTVETVNLGGFYKENLVVGSIPYGVRYLYLSDMYNTEIDVGVIPESVIFLYLGYRFNQILNEGVIPKGTIFLKLGFHYDKYIKKNVIPDGVKYLYIGKSFKQLINKDVIPKNLIELVIYKFNFNDVLEKELIDLNINIGLYDMEYKISYKHNGNNNILMTNDEKNKFDYYISNFTATHRIGTYLFEELLKKVFYPDRLYKICKYYNIKLVNLLEIYR